MIRVFLVIIGILLLILIGVLWIDHASSCGAKPKTLAELQALPTESLARQVVDDLAMVAFAAGAPRDAWKRFNEPARHAWTLAIVEAGSDELGATGFVRAHAGDDGFPRVEDARDACLAMGLGDAAQILEGILSGHGQADADASWLNALRRPESIVRRQEYLQLHLAQIAEPLKDSR